MVVVVVVVVVVVAVVVAVAMCITADGLLTHKPDSAISHSTSI